MIFRNRNIYLSSKRYDYRNVLTVGKQFYKIESLDGSGKKSKGRNSAVFKLIEPNTESEYAIKFCKFPSNSPSDWDQLANKRFDHEISALKQARANGFQNVIRIDFEGKKKIDGLDFKYYVMEKADTDLTSYLAGNEIALNQKIQFCLQIAKGISELHGIDLFHRDIKPDNIFIITNGEKSVWKIGDLGLSLFRGQDFSKEEFRDKIGPFGWLSPEVMNKVLCEGTEKEKIFSCKIDNVSDVFQLGKLFWFISQGNVPIGLTRFTDFTIRKREIFDIISKMIQYKKSRRIKLNNVITSLERLSY